MQMIFSARAHVTWFVKQPIYLWLLGVFPILYLYSQNLGLVIDREVVSSSAVILAATTIAFLFTNRFIGNRHKTALMLSVASACFSFSGHIYTLVFIPRSLFVWTLMISAAALLIMFGIYRKSSRKALPRLSATLNVIVLALLVSPSVTIASGLAYMSSFSASTVGSGADIGGEEPSPKLNDSATHPDIYFIIPDAYPSDAWLLEIMDYDNSAFTEALRERGFVVVPHAQSNYGSTFTTLATILNLRYFDHNPSQLEDLDYLRLSIAESEVARQLQRLGYTYIQLLSGMLVPSSTADINRDYAPAGAIEIEVGDSGYSAAVMYRDKADIFKSLKDRGSFYKQSFVSLYLDTTLLRVVKSQLDKLVFKDDFSPYHQYAGERFLDTVADTETFAAMPEATFAIVHLLKPHYPAVFNEHGETIEPVYWTSPEHHLAELEYVNSRYLQMIDAILAKSQHQPIIIFQADHGSTHGKPLAAERRVVHFDAYAAYYLPDGYAVDFPMPYTFINTFPLIMNEVFATDFELQEDRLFELLRGYDAPFEQADVTEEFLHR